jgi:hypothetical protein
LQTLTAAFKLSEQRNIIAVNHVRLTAYGNRHVFTVSSQFTLTFVPISAAMSTESSWRRGDLATLVALSKVVFGAAKVRRSIREGRGRNHRHCKYGLPKWRYGLFREVVSLNVD